MAMEKEYFKVLSETESLKQVTEFSSFPLFINSLPNGKFLDWSKWKALADDKINVTQNLKFVL